MSVFSKTMGSLLEKTLLSPATVASVRTLGRFRLVALQGDGFKKRNWTPGDKLRVKLGDLDLRTYTPIAWDAEHGVTRLLAWLPGRGPGSAWAGTVAPGRTFFFLGPQASLDLSSAAAGPVVFCGDETALGAAAALRSLRREDLSVRFVFELEDPAGAMEALAAVGLADAVTVAKKAGGGHLEEVRARVRDCVDGWNGPGVVFLVGNQETLKVLRAGLAKDLEGKARIVVKVYWREGKRGLD